MLKSLLLKLSSWMITFHFVLDMYRLTWVLTNFNNMEEFVMVEWTPGCFYTLWSGSTFILCQSHSSCGDASRDMYLLSTEVWLSVTWPWPTSDTTVLEHRSMSREDLRSVVLCVSLGVLCDCSWSGGWSHWSSVRLSLSPPEVWSL